jgi:hypothetical protein
LSSPGQARVIFIQPFCNLSWIHTAPGLASRTRHDQQFKVGDKVRANLHHGKTEEAIVRAAVQDDDGIIKLQVVSASTFRAD